MIDIVPPATATPSDEWIEIAQTRSPWSVRGHIKIQPLCDWETLLALTVWQWVSTNPQDGRPARDLTCVEKRFLDGKNPAIRFEGLHRREDADALKNGCFRVRTSELPPLKDDEYYWKDLLGLMVENREGENLGIVTQVEENLANTFLAILPPGGKKSFNLPFVPHYIVSVDIHGKKIVVDWQEAWNET